MAHATYLENEIMNASSERLVQILYGLAIDALQQAQKCIQESDVPGRVRWINKAFAVLVELSNGLDFDAGKEIALNYASIYDYCRRQLLEANHKQSIAILKEITSLLVDLQEAWQIVVTRISAERTARFASNEILPSERALAGCLDCLA